MARTTAGSHPGGLVFRLVSWHVLWPVIADVLAAIRRGIATGRFPGWSWGPGVASLLARRLLIESLFGDSECVDCRRHTAVKDHLGDDFRNLLLRDSDVQGSGDVPFNHLGTVPQNHQSGDGAETAGSQVNGRAIVNLAVDHRVN